MTDSYIDPTTGWVWRESGMTSRKLINLAKRSGWKTCKIYGRIHIGLEDYKAWIDAGMPVQP